MEQIYDKPRLWKKVIRGFLDVIVAISLLIAVVTSVLVHGVLDIDKFKDSICNQEFDNSVKQTVFKSLEANNSVIELDSQQLFNDANIDELVLYAREYTKDFIECLFSNKKFEPKPFDNKKFQDAVIKQLKASGELTEEEISEITAEAMKNMQDTLQYIPTLIKNKVQDVAPIFLRLSILKLLEVPLYFFAFILAVANFIFGQKNHRLDVAFGLSASCFIAFITVFIPLLMLALYNVPAKIAISESLLLFFVKGINKALVVNMAVILCIALVLITVALVFSIILIAKSKAKQGGYKKL
ncbi:MAG: hypothetical protein E7365_06535 [Clostridiales bacterium]|nr:hypothetical protein [Clostridiales bacterium]